MSTDTLQLPTLGRLMSKSELAQAYQRAQGVFETVKARLHLDHPDAPWVLVDGEDASGRTYVVGSDKEDMARDYWMKFQRPMHTTCYFRLKTE